MNNIYENIISLCEKAGITGGKLCRDIGIQRSLLTDLKMERKKTLSVDTLAKIASYFGVSVDHILGNTEKENAPTHKDEREIMSPDVLAIVSACGRMTPEQVKSLRKYAEYMFPQAFSDIN